MSTPKNDVLTADDESPPKVTGRNRFCKQCRFTCTDSKEFLQHQRSQHGDSEEKNQSANVTRRNSLKNNNHIPVKSRSSRSNSEHSIDSEEHSMMMSDNLPDFVNHDNSLMDEMLDEENEEGGRLVIAEEGDATPVTPTRCGNIQNRTYVCNVCEFTSTSAKTFLHHQKDAHKHDFIIYECDICEYATKYKQKLPRHRKLHFSGQEGQLLAAASSASDHDDLNLTPNSSMNEKDFSLLEDSMKHEYVDDEVYDEDDDDEEEIVTVEPEAPEETAAAAAVAVVIPPPVEKTKKTRQEVDPAKYFEVVDESGIKFACSCCGNIYKWRKSLNKHWKEKHNNEVPDNSKKPPGLLYLLNSGNHTIYGRRRIYCNSILSGSTTNGATVPSPNVSRSETPLSTSTHQTNSPPHRVISDREVFGGQGTAIPNYIGPFITNTSHQVYNPPGGVASERPASRISAVPHTSDFSASPSSQSEPLDFSVKREDNETLDPNFFKVKMEPLWDCEDDAKDSAASVAIKPAVLQCSKCTFVAKTLVDYSAHMTLHLNKRAFKCAECQEHYNGVDELNKHFLDSHAEKIQEHKDAIQKIPHGLQQTYHLLKMPLNTITGLNTQELTATDSKQLKCNMCDFVAKWPAELQKHAVSHSEERPFMCMVCGSTYKWKWDLVKHFEKSHHTLPNPYKRRENVGNSKTMNHSLHEDITNDILSKNENREEQPFLEMPPLLPVLWNGEPLPKRRRMSDSDMPDLELRTSDTAPHRLSPDDIPGLIRADQRYSEFESDRPSSVPTRLNAGNGDSAEDSFKQIRITNVQSIMDEDDLKDDIFGIKRPITEETQKAIAAAVRQRQINQSCNRPEDKFDLSSLTGDSDILLPYKCSRCEYRARWPSEITQHMKNHSDEKPYHCPRCNYKSKWKWDVVKHMKRCGGGTIKDVIDTTKARRMVPPNVTVLPEGDFQQQTPQPVAYLINSNNLGSPAVLLPVMPGLDSNISPGLPSNVSIAMQNKLGQSVKSLAPPPPLIPPGKQKQPVFRSLINQGLYHCLECPFIGHSPAELKRHSVLHSERKPFSCRVCGYSSRWKCDLKKHVQSYNHYSEDGDDVNDGSITIDDDIPSDEEEMLSKSIVKCGKCSYVTYSNDILDVHMKTHSDENTPPAKFKCKQCSFQGNDLSTFLQHRITHSLMSAQQNGDVHKSGDIDEARLKHPRKQMKTLQCSSCSFVCSKRETMQAHEQEHASPKYKCFYCDYMISDKDSFLDHVSTHSEFNPEEMESFFTAEKQGDEEEIADLHGLGNAKPLEHSTPVPNHASQIDNQKFMASIGFPHLSLPPFVQQSHCKSSSEFTQIVRSTPENLSKQQIVSKSNFRTIQPAPVTEDVRPRKYECEWCEATFAHISTVYQHAKNCHPIELHRQEMNEKLKQTLPSDRSPSNHLPAMPSPNVSVLKSTLQTNALRSELANSKLQLPTYSQVLQNLRKAPGGERAIAPALLNPPPPYGSAHASPDLFAAKAKKTTSPYKKARSFQCTKCPFTAPNAVTYLRHIERHGSNCKHTCWFCDYSIDRLNLLYQHMKGTHPDQWKGSGTTSENPIAKEKSFTYPDESKIDDHVPADSTSIGGDSYEGIKEKVLPKDGLKPVLILKEQTTWRGVPIEICIVDGKKNFKCPKCPYVSDNAVKTSNHVRQHGSTRKYQCKNCEYSVDNLQLIYSHMNLAHPNQQAFIEVNKNIEVAPVDLEMQDDTPADKGNGDKKAAAANLLNCPRCPFRNRSRDIFQRHLEMHRYNGKYRCEHCSYSVDRLPLLTQHATLHENQKGVAKIHPEKEHFTSLLNLKSVDRTPGSNKVQTASGVMSKSLTMQAKQVLARSKLNGRIRYKCSRCPYNTFCKNNLIKHRKQHIIKSRYTCNKCSYSATREYLLQQHFKFHEDEDNGQNQIKIEDFQDVIMDPFEPLDCSDAVDMTTSNKTSSCSTPNHFEEADLDEDMDKMDDEDEIMNAEMEGISDEETLDKNFFLEKPFRNHKCPSCPFSSNYNLDLKKHVKLHGAMFRYRCDYCSYSVERLNLLNQHRRLHQFEEAFVHEPSPALLLNKDAINLENSLNNTVADCAEKVTSSSNGTPSNECGGGDGDEGDMRYLCPSCPYKSNSIKSFNVHSHMHGLNRKYICDHCDWSVDRLNLLYQHRKVHAREDNYVPNLDEIHFLNREYALEAPKRFHAQIQDFEKEAHNVDGSSVAAKEEPETALNLTKDSKINGVAEKKMFLCKLCPFSSSSKNSYVYHKVLHRMKARYACPQCSFSVDRYNLLIQHMRLHEEEKATSNSKHQQMKCPKCPYQSPSVQLLNAHIGMHASGGQYACSFCDLSTDQHNVLQQHLKVHKESPKSPMRNAKEAIEKVTPQLFFNSPDDPDTNGSDNSEETELKCARCPFSTPSKKQLEDHDFQHGIRDRLQCPYCDLSCPRDLELLEHVQVHFPGSPIDMKTLKQMMLQRTQENNNNITPQTKSFRSSITKLNLDESSMDHDEGRFPDSTVREMQKTALSDMQAKISEGSIAEKMRMCTKVYVCQYCEREFQSKEDMLQHEPLHLIGH